MTGQWVGTSALLAIVAVLLFFGIVISLSIAIANNDAVPLLVYVGLTIALPGAVVAYRRPTDARRGLSVWALGSLLVHVTLLPLGFAALAM